MQQAEAKSQTFELPIPPSANRYWRKYRNRMVLSEEAKDYRKAVGAIGKASGVEQFEGDVVVYLVVYRARKSGDLDNFQKVLLDALKGIAYADDNQVVELHAYRFDDKHNLHVMVTISRGGKSHVKP